MQLTFHDSAVKKSSEQMCCKKVLGGDVGGEGVCLYSTLRDQGH